MRTYALIATSLATAAALALAITAPRLEAQAKQGAASTKDAGWITLFDGTSTDQWRGYQKPDMTGLRWTVKDGCLGLPPAEGADTRGSRDIITKQQFDDFDLQWEWKISKGGNSGVKYFVTENRPSAIGHEYQIIDDNGHPDAKMRDGLRQTGAFYDVLKATGVRTKPVGEFNQSRVLVHGNHVEHWLNGTKILEYELDTDALRKAIADSKFKDIEGFDKHTRGHILLQDHGDAVCYRNVKIRPLT